MEFRILGPLEALAAGGEAVPLGGGKRCALLSVLLLNVNRTVPVARLIDDLWGDAVPDTATKAVQIYVSQLRKLLPEQILHTRSPGYVLELQPEQIDLFRFERLLAEGRQALAAGSPQLASELLGEALSLWRGAPLAEFTEPFAQVEGARLEELRLAAMEERIEADLASGRHGELAGELETLLRRHPLRERLRGQHMLALYRSGRQAEALAGYQEFRRLLDEELGIEPSARLRELERRILRQDPELELEGSIGATALAERRGPPPAALPASRQRAELRSLSVRLAGREVEIGRPAARGGRPSRRPSAGVPPPRPCGCAGRSAGPGARATGRARALPARRTGLPCMRLPASCRFLLAVSMSRNETSLGPAGKGKMRSAANGGYIAACHAGSRRPDW
jgi:DNA-binding SARP family transcriptional activator